MREETREEKMMANQREMERWAKEEKRAGDPEQRRGGSAGQARPRSAWCGCGSSRAASHTPGVGEWGRSWSQFGEVTDVPIPEHESGIKN